MINVTHRTRIGLEILGTGLVLGVLGDGLLRAMPWGLNVTLCAVALTAAATLLVRRHGITPGPDAPWLALTVVLLGAAFMRRDSEVLVQFNVIAMIIALALGAASLQGERIAAMRPLDQLRAGFTTAVGTLTGSLVLVGHDVQWHELPRGGRVRRGEIGSDSENKRGGDRHRAQQPGGHWSAPHLVNGRNMISYAVSSSGRGEV